MEDLIGLVVTFGLFGWIPIVVYFKHKIYLEQLKHRNDLADEHVVQSLDELRREVRELRDTTMKFDKSFDAALTEMEQRVDEIDTRTASARAARADEPARLRVGRGGGAA